MRIDLKEIGGSDVLSGALAGKDVLGKLLQRTNESPKAPSLIFLDFSHVSVATASFLRESIFTFRDVVRGKRSMFYPVIANPNDAVKEELSELINRGGSPFITCQLSQADKISDVHLIGQLDQKQRLTFELVQKHKLTDAGELMRNYNEEDIKQTAWNNRLSALVNMGLIIEISEGRSKKYRPLFDEKVIYGS